MREIKFRAWCKFENKMYNKFYIEDHMKFAFMDELIDSAKERYELMQYTGLKDVNDVEIYEGDIVDFTFFDHYDNGTNYKGVVKYRSGIYEIWKNNDSEFFGSDGPFILNFAWLQTEEFEVIGNIYENPELLEEKTHD